ncbi:MAG: ABC transporter substrate-binding protein [Thioploca sp.]|nr:ABC transporter substrate-binding protein [Thioploca sp.]
MATRVYLGLLLIMVELLFLSACSPSPEEQVKARIELAKFEDTMAKCRLLILNKDFKERREICKDFLEEDAKCAYFPERKDGCLRLIGTSSYNAQKLECMNFSHEEQECATIAETKIHHSWFYDAAKLVGLDGKKKDWIEKVQEFTSEIHLGVIWSGNNKEEEKDSFLDGVKLAVEEINNQNGILGRKLAIHKEYIERNNLEGKSLDKSREIAERMRNNEKIRAVIGRQSSSLTIPFTYVYESSNIVYFAVSATNNNVIRHGMRFIFRQLPDNKDFARALVNFCKLQKYQKLSLLYSRDSYSEELSYAFRDYAIENKFNIVFEKSFFQDQENFMDIAANIANLNEKPDAIFLATVVPTAVRVVKDLRSMEITIPLIGSDALDGNNFAHAVGEQGDHLVVPTIYNPFSKHPENISFVKAYKRRYGNQPDTWAAQGYDAVNLLAYTMSKGITVPTSIATNLRYQSHYTGATGRYSYDENGNLQEKPIYFKELQHEEFILFKDTKQEEEKIQQTQQLEIVDDRVILRPEKPSESMEAISSVGVQ